ncbi:hypothetical protein [Nocardia fluminea]|uniref:hypothetical protein n=1 Tax=Nocardia fluminea TaxID=134984 RepID=UPI003422AA9D
MAHSHLVRGARLPRTKGVVSYVTVAARPPAREIVLLSPLACWYFVLGWAGAKATAVWQRLIVSAVLLACVPGYFGVVERKRLVTADILIGAGCPRCACPAFGDQRSLALVACPAAGAAVTEMADRYRHRIPWLTLQGQHLSGRLVRQLRDQQVTRNRLAGKVIE